MVSIQAQWSPKKQEDATKAASAHQQHHYLNPSPAVVVVESESERATSNRLETSCLLVKEAAVLVQLLQQAHPTNSPSKSSDPNKMDEEEKDLNYPKQE
jgi:hypothetical protein